MSDPASTIPLIPGTSDSNADLPSTPFPRLQRLQPTDLVGTVASNRQHASLEKRTETLRETLNQIIDAMNQMDTWFLRRNGSTQKDGVAGLVESLPMNNKQLTALRAAVASGEAVRYEEYVALASLVNGVSSTPIGMIGTFGNTPPAGWLACDGTLYTTTGYTRDDGTFSAYLTAPGSLSWLSLTNLRGYLLSSWGGDGVSSFRVPDYRGRVIVGAGVGKNGQVVEITVTNKGGGYSSVPVVTISPPVGGVQATAEAVIESGMVVAVRIINPGSGYTNNPSVTFAGGNGSSAAATARAMLTTRLIGSYGGAESHTLTVLEMPTHTHKIVSSATGVWGNGVDYGPNNTYPAQDTYAAGGSGAHNNMQPWATATLCIKY